MFSALIAGLLFAATQNNSDDLLTSESLLDTHLWPKFARVFAVSDDGHDILFIDEGWISGQRYKRDYIMPRFQFANSYAKNTYLPTSFILGGDLFERANETLDLTSRDWLLWPIEPLDGSGPMRLTLPFQANVISGQVVSKRIRRLILLRYLARRQPNAVYEAIIQLPKSGVGVAKVANTRRLRFFPPSDKHAGTTWNGWIGFARQTAESANMLPKHLARIVRDAGNSGNSGKLFVWNDGLYETIPGEVFVPAEHFRPGAGLWKWDGKYWRLIGERNCEAISANGKWAVLKGPADATGRWTYYLASSRGS
jgi:hypothetical protein